MELFVAKNSIVRKIWGKSDTVLFIFAGASAEFALNKAVDWLYYTGNYRQILWEDYFQPLITPEKLFFRQRIKLIKRLIL